MINVEGRSVLGAGEVTEKVVWGLKGFGNDLLEWAGEGGRLG